MKHLFWQVLRPHDSVDIVAPASYCTTDQLNHGLEWIKKIKLTPRVPTDIMKKDLFFAANLQTQFEHLKEAIYSDSKAIWCLRGGYGSMRLIPQLFKLRPPKRPKLFIGFSDITSLHLFFTQVWNWPVIHGRTITQMHPDLSSTPDRRLMKDIVFGKKTEKVFKKLTPLNDSARIPREIRGVITGGNLRIIQSSLGTPWEIKAGGKILFLEDVGERGYSVDRMLEQLIQANILNNKIKAVIFGDFTEGFEKNGENLVPLALERFAQKVPFPVLQGLPCGHDKDVNYPLAFNTRCFLRGGRRGELHCFFGGE